jgi:hypothetical protein
MLSGAREPQYGLPSDPHISLPRLASASEFLPCHLRMGSSCLSAAMAALTSAGHEYYIGYFFGCLPFGCLWVCIRDTANMIGLPAGYILGITEAFMRVLGSTTSMGLWVSSSSIPLRLSTNTGTNRSTLKCATMPLRFSGFITK